MFMLLLPHCHRLNKHPWQGALPSDTGSVSLLNFEPTERGQVKRRQYKNNTGFGELAKLKNKEVC